MYQMYNSFHKDLKKYLSVVNLHYEVQYTTGPQILLTDSPDLADTYQTETDFAKSILQTLIRIVINKLIISIIWPYRTALLESVAKSYINRI